MRWDCATCGCFNQKLRPKIELFAEFLPGNTSFGDVDGLHEYNGRFLLLEWKTHRDEDLPPPAILTGQDRTYRQFTSRLQDDAVVICAAGDAESMDVLWSKRYLRGGRTGWTRSTFVEVGEMMRRFCEGGIVNMLAAPKAGA